MSMELMGLILIGGLLLLLFIGAEIFVAIGVMGAIGLLFFLDKPLNQFAFTAFDSVNSFVLTAVPLFIFMGAIFANTGVIRSLFSATEKWFGIFPGGLACSVTMANALFGAMSGSTIAAAATFGKIAFPEMYRLGYNPRLALGSIAVAGGLATLIPPSLCMIVYGGWEDVSVVRLFAAGMIPGIIMALLLMFTVMVQVKLNPSLAPKPPKFTWRERLSAIKDIAPFAGVIALVLGTIFGGIMTPTESAALGALLSIVLALAYRKMTFTALRESMMATIKISAMLAFVIFTARVLGMVFNHMGLTGAFSAVLMGLPFGKYGIFAVIVVMYLIMGMFFDAFSMLVLTLPFVSPIIASLGFSPIWFGIVYVILGEIGVITPPFGLNLFALQAAVDEYDIDIMTIALGSLPFLLPMLLVIVLLVAFPQLALWLPGVLYG